ncbi:MAG TPA: glycoside hydrolase family 32 protein [Acidobacteriaceae bacterium]|nr:glycoside hydrolase family 32 protein [Acidobacteriaceae bacterium]
MTRSRTLTRRKLLASTAAAIAALNSPLTEILALAALPESDLARDPRRPQYHLLPARNWMNDPNGPIYWKGKYHMFFQYNPNAAVWGDMHWAHSVSPDMIHWRHLPIALAPTLDGPDADGCFSGTAVVNNGVPTFIYTGVQTVPADKAAAEATIRDGHNNFRETQLYATSTDPNLLTWTKRPTPVIPAPPEGMKVTGFRDPAPWHEASLAGGQWLMAVGSGTKEHGGCVLLYKSTDLQTWEYLHVAAGGASTGSATTNPVDSGDMWECPDLFPLGNKHVLIYSTQGKVFWKVGQLDPTELVFHEQQSGLLDYGSFYAPKTQLDKSGNRILWGWIQETRPEAEFSASGWSGLMSLPRVLSIGADGRLHVTVAPIAEKLRKHEQKLRLTPIKPGSKELLADTHLKDACGELLCIVKPGSEPFSLDLLDTTKRNDAPKDSTTTVTSQVSLISVRYSHANPKELVVDQQRLPIFPEKVGPDPGSATAGQPLELRFYIDGSVIELFVNNQVTCTRRFYYPGSTAPEIAVSITGNQSDISRLSLWQLNPISKDRLTT